MRNGGTADLVNARNIHLDVVDGEHGWGYCRGRFVTWRLSIPNRTRGKSATPRQVCREDTYGVIPMMEIFRRASNETTELKTKRLRPLSRIIDTISHVYFRPHSSTLALHSHGEGRAASSRTTSPTSPLHISTAMHRQEPPTPKPSSTPQARARAQRMLSVSDGVVYGVCILSGQYSTSVVLTFLRSHRLAGGNAAPEWSTSGLLS